MLKHKFSESLIISYRNVILANIINIIIGRGPGGRAPWWGLQGGSAPLRREILHFWTQFARFILKISWSISNKSVIF